MKSTIVVFVFFLITSCMTISPITNLNERINIYGVSSMPPQSGGWMQQFKSGYQMVLGKLGSTSDESHIVNVSVFQLQEFTSDEKFLAFVIKWRAEASEIRQFELQHNSEILSTLNGASCIKFHSISKDKRAQTQSGKTSQMLLESIGYDCQHPKNKKVGVNIEYSLRYYPESAYPSFEKDVDEFFAKIKFTDF